jgi:hypothetical protein
MYGDIGYHRGFTLLARKWIEVVMLAHCRVISVVRVELAEDQALLALQGLAGAGAVRSG